MQAIALDVVAVRRIHEHVAQLRGRVIVDVSARRPKSLTDANAVQLRSGDTRPRRRRHGAQSVSRHVGQRNEHVVVVVGGRASRQQTAESYENCERCEMRSREEHARHGRRTLRRSSPWHQSPRVCTVHEKLLSLQRRAAAVAKVSRSSIP